MSDLTTDCRPTDVMTLIALAIYYEVSVELYYDTDIKMLKKKKIYFDNDGPLVCIKLTVFGNSVGHYEPIIADEITAEKKDDTLILVNETQKSIDDFIYMTNNDPTLQQRFHVTLKLSDEYDVPRSLIHIMNEFNLCSFPALLITTRADTYHAFDSIEGPLNVVSNKKFDIDRKNTSMSVLEFNKLNDYISNIYDSHRLVIVDVASNDYNDDDDTLDVIFDAIETMILNNSDLIVRFNITPTKKHLSNLTQIMSCFNNSQITYGVSEGTTTPVRYLICYDLVKYPTASSDSEFKSFVASPHYQLLHHEYFRFSVHVDALSALYDNKEINYVTDCDYESCYDMSSKIKGGSLNDLKNLLILVKSIYQNVEMLESGNSVVLNNDLLPYIIEKFKKDVDSTCKSVLDVLTLMKPFATRLTNFKKLFSGKITTISPIKTMIDQIVCTCKTKSYYPNLDGFFLAACNCDLVLVLIVNGYCVHFIRDKYYVKNAVTNTVVRRMYKTNHEAKQCYLTEIALKSFQMVYAAQVIDKYENDLTIERQLSASIRDSIMKTTINNDDMLQDKSATNTGHVSNDNEMKSDDNKQLDFSVALHQSLLKSTVTETLNLSHKVFSKDPQVDALKNSFIEVSNIWSKTHLYHESEMKLVYNVASKTSDVKSICNWLETRPDNVHVNYYGRWLPTKPALDYMYVYTGDGFKKTQCVTRDELYVVADYTEKKFEPVFIQKTSAIMDNIDKLSVKTKFLFISGVPGCGKTYYIMKNHSDTDLVLSATKAGAMEFREKATKQKKPDVMNRYRTVYSYLYNDTKEYDVVWIDEAMMLHPGMIFAIAILTKCKTMHMIGDHKQIPYYTRIDYPSRYHVFSKIFPIDKELTTSYRCPQDVADYMKRYYKNFSSKSKIIKSLSKLYVSGVSEIPQSYDAYLTFTQSDKQLLIRDFTNVYTIHEYQGKQAKKICLFRGSPTPIKTYDSIEHHIVGLTRHTEKFLYASVVMDKLYESIVDVRGGGSTINYSVENIMTAVRTKNILYFDTGIKSAIHIDLRTYIQSLNSKIGIEKAQCININDGYINVYSHGVNRTLYHVVFDNVMSSRSLLKTVRNATEKIFDLPCDDNTNTLHTIDSLSKFVDWKIATTYFSDCNRYLVHDQSHKLDKYRLVDIIKKTHDLCFSDDIYDENYSEEYHDIKPVGLQPNVCVLVYTDMNYDFGTTSKYRFVSLFKDTIISSIDNKKFFNNVAVLSKHSSKYVNKTIQHTSVKNFSSVNALVEYYKPDSHLQDVRVLQNFIDTMLPNAVDIRTDYDVALVAHSDFSVHLQSASFDASMIHHPVKFFNHVRPVLSTAMSPPRPTNSLKELTKAIEKRNCAVPKIQVTMDVWSKAKQLFDKMIRLVYDASCHDDIALTENVMQEWLDTQNSNISNLIKSTHYNDLNVNSYSLTIKKNSKPALDMSAVNTYASLQTVVFTPKDFNTLFCPMFKIMKKRMISTMNEKFLMYTDMPPEKFSTILSQKFSSFHMNDYHSLEFDVSKYDKSQNLLHLIVDCMIMRHFGIPECFVMMWFNGHCNTKLYDPTNRFYCDVFFQRKSGDPSTWLLNTQQIITMIVNCIPEPAWSQIILVIASGDDSEIFSNGKLQIDNLRFSDVFNYEVKVYDNYTSLYFCSKFLIVTQDGTYMLPDLYKLIKKLGRHDLKTREHVLSFRNSVLDSLKDFSIPIEIMLAYEKAMFDRYKFPGWFTMDTVYQSLCNLVYDPSGFETLYIPNEEYYSNKFGTVSDL